GAAAGLAGVGLRAGVAVVARRPVGLGRVRAEAARRIADARDVALVLGGADDRVAAGAGAGLAGVGPGTGVAVAAARAREWRHRTARRAVAGPRVALVGGAGDRRADTLAAAGAGIVERAGVAVVAARARERGHRTARRAVAGAGGGRVRG